MPLSVSSSMFSVSLSCWRLSGLHGDATIHLERVREVERSTPREWGGGLEKPGGPHRRSLEGLWKVPRGSLEGLEEVSRKSAASREKSVASREECQASEKVEENWCDVVKTSETWRITRIRKNSP